jgi:hypothetical protein
MFQSASTTYQPNSLGTNLRNRLTCLLNSASQHSIVQYLARKSWYRRFITRDPINL